MRGQHHNQGMDIEPTRLLMLLGNISTETKPRGATREKGTARAAAPGPGGPRWDHELPVPPQVAVTTGVTSTVGRAAPQEALPAGACHQPQCSSGLREEGDTPGGMLSPCETTQPSPQRSHTLG